MLPMVVYTFISAIPLVIHSALVRGILPFLYEIVDDTYPINACLAATTDRSNAVEDHQCVYGIWLVDKVGNLHTAEEIKAIPARIQEGVRTYGTPRTTQEKTIDAVLPKEGDIDRHFVHIQRFHDAVLPRMQALPVGALRLPLSAPLCYFGYSSDIKSRRESHETATKRSNYIMRYSCEISKVLYGEKYFMLFQILYHIPYGFLESFAEVFSSYYGQCMAASGGGFTCVGAGYSVGKDEKFSSKRWAELLRYTKTIVEPDEIMAGIVQEQEEANLASRREYLEKAVRQTLCVSVGDAASLRGFAGKGAMLESDEAGEHRTRMEVCCRAFR